jgi:uncharacterized protein YbaR (Trm112 family)
MGEQEKCPKCKGRLRYDEGGYGKANASSGSIRGALPNNIYCLICGYYKEIFPDRIIVEEFKKDYQHLLRYHCRVTTEKALVDQCSEDDG